MYVVFAMISCDGWSVLVSKGGVVILQCDEVSEVSEWVCDTTI